MVVKQRKFSKVLLMSFTFITLLGGFAFAKPKSELVKQEPGYYYGFGQAATQEEAEFMAKKDLIENSLTATLRNTDPAAQQIIVSDDTVDARLKDQKPFYQSKNGLKVAYRMKIADWDKEAKAYSDKLRKSLNEDYQVLSVVSSKTSARLDAAVKILNVLAENGETDLLTLQEKGTEIYARKVEKICLSIVNNLKITVSEADKIITPDAQLVVTVVDNNGKAVDGVSVKAVWEAAYLPLTSTADELQEVLSVLTTDSEGKAVVEYPIDESYLNKIVSLTVSTAFSTADHTTKAMKLLDVESAVEARFFCVENVEDAFKFVAIEAGEYDAGALAKDKKAAFKEEARKVKLNAYEMGVTPVTNLQYVAYVYLTRAETYPEYLDNDDYNNELQPVIGVSSADAEAFAAWLSAQTGVTYRLPTDDEWEVAARGGMDYIYPWGDDDPSKAKKANYKGNGSFKGPSPVGEFTEAVNALGLVDMSGNVWEWTSSARKVEDESDMRTVKGGSWMDGPADLRISNFKNIDSTIGYADVGFRLVKEPAKE